MVLIVLEHQPSAQNALWEPHFTLCGTWEGRGFGLCFVEEGDRALSVYPITSSNTW